MSNSEPFDSDTAEQENEFQGFDAFWGETLRKEAAEHGLAPTEVIRGVKVKVPQDLPLKFRAKARAMRNEDGDDAFRELLAGLFGADVLDAWDAAGMGAREFRIVLAWGMSHGEGTPITWQQAYESVMAKDDEAGDEGKAPSSTRKSGVSGGSGRSSKPTSAGNTSSRRQTSRT